MFTYDLMLSNFSDMKKNEDPDETKQNGKRKICKMERLPSMDKMDVSIAQLRKRCFAPSPNIQGSGGLPLFSCHWEVVHWRCFFKKFGCDGDLAARPSCPYPLTLADYMDLCTTSLSQAVQRTLLKLKQMVRRQRNKLGTPLAAPTNLETLVIPDEFTMQVHTYEPHHGEIVSFSHADSGPSRPRIHIFGSHHKVAILNESRTWYVYGTSQLALLLFC
ncbi:hypothetical protein T10_5653 [Trichinella papuae]|uniref:Uncharacterized protein n=1 Tax=Trichinella papuae TaxID=268474 RepID=A0A0V1MAV9_9BILA|nr:hypothetical protein T10_5653 [Trichinella papuae]